MSKRFSKGHNPFTPSKRQKLEVTVDTNTSVKEKRSSSNVTSNNKQINVNDVWGDDFEEDEIEKMDFIASQATQEEAVFIPPKPIVETCRTSRTSSLESFASTSSHPRGILRQKTVLKHNDLNSEIQSQMLGSSDINKEIFESTQAIIFDDFENEVKANSVNSTFRARQDTPNSNVVLVTDDDQLEKWKEEKKKLLEDFMTKEGETEFLRQQLSQIQMRAEHAKKEQARLMEDQIQKFRAEINGLMKEKTALESQLQYQTLQLNNIAEKNKLLESGSVRFAQPQVTMVKSKSSLSNLSMNWSTKKVKTKESSVQVEEVASTEILKTSLIQYPLRTIPQCIFQPPEPEKSVIDIKIEEKIGKRNLAILQEEETFRIFENPEVSKPKVTIINGKNLSTEFFLPDLAKLMNKTSEEINSSEIIPIINKLVSTARELLLNSMLVLQQISEALQNDDVRDMNELYLSEFYEMPMSHTKCFLEARPWYELERGIETRRAIGVLAHIAAVSSYLADYVAGKQKLTITQDPEYSHYIGQMSSYQAWQKKNSDFEFLDIVMEFVTVVGSIRRSHQFSGLINAIITLITNVQTNVGFSSTALMQVHSIIKEVIYSRPLLNCFTTISTTLKEFSHNSSFVSKLCISPGKSAINYWKGSLNFTTDACALEIFITQLDHFKLDPITLINITKDLAIFSNIALLSDSIPWIEKTTNSCNCCLNLLKFVITSLYECSKIVIEELKNKYANADMPRRMLTHEDNNEQNKIFRKTNLIEDWQSFENQHKENLWDVLKTSQSSAIAYGIRLLSFLAKRDLDFMIRLTYIEDAFHLFLNNLSQRKDLKLKTSDEIALDIVKETFVLEKNKEENKNNKIKLNIVNLENERWTDFIPTSSDLMKLYNDSL